MQVVQGFPKTQPTQELSGNPSNSSTPVNIDFLISYRQKCKFLAGLGTPPRPHVEEQEDHLDQAPCNMWHQDAESIPVVPHEVVPEVSKGNLYIYINIKNLAVSQSHCIARGFETPTPRAVVPRTQLKEPVEPI